MILLLQDGIVLRAIRFPSRRNLGPDLITDIEMGKKASFIQESYCAPLNE